MSDTRQINQYLFYEFGYDLQHDAAAVCDDWPFQLRTVGTISSAGQATQVLEFSADDRRYYVLSGEMLSYLPAAGMSLHDLQLQQDGQAWIARQDPIDLETSRLLDKTIPSGMERRATVEKLSTGACSSPRVLEGLYLRRTRRYLVLVEDTSNGEVVVVSSDLAPRPVSFPLASPWRRLALAVGGMLAEGILREK